MNSTNLELHCLHQWIPFFGLLDIVWLLSPPTSCRTVGHWPSWYDINSSWNIEYSGDSWGFNHSETIASSGVHEAKEKCASLHWCLGNISASRQLLSCLSLLEYCLSFLSKFTLVERVSLSKTVAIFISSAVLTALIMMQQMNSLPSLVDGGCGGGFLGLSIQLLFPAICM